MEPPAGENSVLDPQRAGKSPASHRLPFRGVERPLPGVTASVPGQASRVSGTVTSGGPPQAVTHPRHPEEPTGRAVFGVGVGVPYGCPIPRQPPHGAKQRLDHQHPAIQAPLGQAVLAVLCAPFPGCCGHTGRQGARPIPTRHHRSPDASGLRPRPPRPPHRPRGHHRCGHAAHSQTRALAQARRALRPGGGNKPSQSSNFLSADLAPS